MLAVVERVVRAVGDALEAAGKERRARQTTTKELHTFPGMLTIEQTKTNELEDMVKQTTTNKLCQFLFLGQSLIL